MECQLAVAVLHVASPHRGDEGLPRLAGWLCNCGRFSHYTWEQFDFEIIVLLLIKGWHMLQDGRDHGHCKLL